MPDSRAITLRDVAARAGVSVATASLALRDSPKIRAETVAKVRAVAVEMGYAPNPLVSALMAQMRGVRPTQDVEVLAFVRIAPSRSPPANMPYVDEILAGARARASALGHKVEVFHLSESDLGEKRLDAILFSRGIRGVVVPPLGANRPRLDLDWSRYAAVALGYSMQQPVLHRVCPDQFQAMILAIEQLRARGYRRIGLYIDEDTDARVRHKFTAAMEWHNHAVGPDERVPLLMTPRLDRARFLAWLERWRPEIVLSWRQVIVDWLREAGMAVPRDIGFAHVNWTERADPCAGIDQRPRLLGMAAVDTVVALLYTNERGIPAVPRTTSIESLWVDGPTTRPAPS